MLWDMLKKALMVYWLYLDRRIHMSFEEFMIVLLSVSDCVLVYFPWVYSNRLCWIDITILSCLGELCIQDTGIESESIAIHNRYNIALCGYSFAVCQLGLSYASRYNKERDCPCSTTESHRCLHADCEASNSSHAKMP